MALAFNYSMHRADFLVTGYCWPSLKRKFSQYEVNYRFYHLSFIATICCLFTKHYRFSF